MTQQSIAEYNQPFVYYESPNEKFTRRPSKLQTVKSLLLSQWHSYYLTSFVWVLHFSSFISDRAYYEMLDFTRENFELFRYFPHTVKDMFPHEKRPAR